MSIYWFKKAAAMVCVASTAGCSTMGALDIDTHQEPMIFDGGKGAIVMHMGNASSEHVGPYFMGQPDIIPSCKLTKVTMNGKPVYDATGGSTDEKHPATFSPEADVIVFTPLFRASNESVAAKMRAQKAFEVGEKCSPEAGISVNNIGISKFRTHAIVTGLSFGPQL